MPSDADVQELGVRITDNAMGLYVRPIKSLVQKNKATNQDLARTLSSKAQAQKYHMRHQALVVVERLKQQYEDNHGIALRVLEDLRHSNLIADQVYCVTGHYAMIQACAHQVMHPKLSSCACISRTFLCEWLCMYRDNLAVAVAICHEMYD